MIAVALKLFNWNQVRFSVLLAMMLLGECNVST